jgi:hypothetical protein
LFASLNIITVIICREYSTHRREVLAKYLIERPGEESTLEGTKRRWMRS